MIDKNVVATSYTEIYIQLKEGPYHLQWLGKASQSCPYANTYNFLTLEDEDGRKSNFTLDEVVAALRDYRLGHR